MHANRYVDELLAIRCGLNCQKTLNKDYYCKSAFVLVRMLKHTLAINPWGTAVPNIILTRHGLNSGYDGVLQGTEFHYAPVSLQCAGASSAASVAIDQCHHQAATDVPMNSAVV